jgi:hypothetical protein
MRKLIEVRPDKHSKRIWNVYLLGHYMGTFCRMYIILNFGLRTKLLLIVGWFNKRLYVNWNNRRVCS